MPKGKSSKRKISTEPVPVPVAAPVAVQAAAPAGAPERTNWGEEIYSGAATVGRIESYFSLFFGNLIGLGFIIGGIYLLATKPSSSTTSPSSFDRMTAPPGFPDPQTNFPTSSTGPTEDEIKSRRIFGGVLILIGLIILAVAWAYWYIIRKSKVAAAASGAGTIVDWVVPGPGGFAPGFGGFGSGNWNF